MDLISSISSKESKNKGLLDMTCFAQPRPSAHSIVLRDMKRDKSTSRVCGGNCCVITSSMSSIAAHTLTTSTPPCHGITVGYLHADEQILLLCLLRPHLVPFVSSHKKHVEMTSNPSRNYPRFPSRCPPDSLLAFSISSASWYSFYILTEKLTNRSRVNHAWLSDVRGARRIILWRVAHDVKLGGAA